MSRLIQQLMIPTGLTAGFFVLAMLPDDLISCRMRGLAAAAYALILGIAAVALAFGALYAKIRGRVGSAIWMMSAFILAIPAIFILTESI